MTELNVTKLDGPLAGGSEGAQVTLRPLLTAEMEAAPGFLHRESGPLGKLHGIGVGVSKSAKIWLPIPAFLVEHPTAGNVVIDTGVHPSVVHDPSASLGRLGAAIYKTRFDHGQPLPTQLRHLGVEPESIETVVLTHMHHDHTGAISEFPNAKFIVTTAEWHAANQPRGFPKGYIKRHFDHAFDYRTIDFDAGTIESFASFGRSFDLFGDGSLMLVSTPGHSPGHQSVILRLASREALICGDAAYTRRTIDEDLLPLIVPDEHNFKRSLSEIRAYLQMTPSALVIPGHDAETWATLQEQYN